MKSKFAFQLSIFAVFILLVSSSLSAAVLNVPERFQECSQWCWAGVSQAIFAYYRIFLTQQEIAAYGTNGYNTWNYLYGSDGESPYYRKGINMILNNWGLSCVYGDYTMTQNGVLLQINSGRPFVIRWGWTSGGGHFVVGRGIEGDYVYYMDPWPSQGYQIELYSWVVDDGSHKWTHSLKLTSFLPTPTPTASLPSVPTPTRTPLPPGQPVPFTENFEGVWSGGAPELWTKEYVTGTHDWVRASGGQDGHPSSAHGGTYNALFFRDDFTMPVTRLITPRLDFGSRTNDTRLTFWQAMEIYGADQDELSVYYRSSGSAPWSLLVTYNTSVSAWTQRTVSLPNPSNDYYLCFEGTARWGYGVCIDDILVTGESLPSLDSGDYNGDGTSDIAIFRGSSGMWSVRGVTRAYFGSSSDIPIPGDYNGDGTTDIGVFRPGSGMWGVRGVTRVYYGSTSDIPIPGDYNGDGTCDVGIFRSSSGLWAVVGVTRAYFGGGSDIAVPGDYDGDGTKDIAVFRGSSGMWAFQGLPRVYFGSSSDTVVPGDYNGDGTWEPGIFRPSTGMWAVTGVTRAYYGSSSDQPVPADYNGDSIDDMGIFRPGSGLWGIRNISRAYFGSPGDIPVTR